MVKNLINLAAVFLLILSFSIYGETPPEIEQLLEDLNSDPTKLQHTPENERSFRVVQSTTHQSPLVYHIFEPDFERSREALDSITKHMGILIPNFSLEIYDQTVMITGVLAKIGELSLSITPDSINSDYESYVVNGTIRRRRLIIFLGWKEVATIEGKIHVFKNGSEPDSPTVLEDFHVEYEKDLCSMAKRIDRPTYRKGKHTNEKVRLVMGWVLSSFIQNMVKPHWWQ